jgi:hypothetical protein
VADVEIEDSVYIPESDVALPGVVASQETVTYIQLKIKN